jgi:response regulator RpfG family c-di-GMP phosphodiesterase
MTKIIVVDDDSDLREVIILVIGSCVKAEFVEAGSGQEAIKAFEDNHLKVDMVISDFNMPNGNGATLAAYLREKGLSLPFLLISSDDREKHLDVLNAPSRSFLQKPFRNEELRSAVETMLKKLEGVDISEQDYVPVSLSTLKRVTNISRPLFIQISDNKYVRVVNPGSFFTDEEFERFNKKKVAHLFVQKDDVGPLLNEFRTLVFSEMYFKSLKERSADAINLSKSTLELIQVAVRSMNWSPEIINLGNENVRMIQNIVAATPDINNVFDWFITGEHELGVSTGILMSYFLTSLTKSMEMTNQRELEVLSMAGFFHDMLLDDYQIRNQDKFIKALLLGSSSNRENIEHIKNHPLGARDILAQWEHCPVGLLEIIEQHHELPDGSGFPRGLRGIEIHPLAAIFIVACEAIEIFIRTKDKIRVYEHLVTRAHVFSQAPTQKAYEATLKLFDLKSSSAASESA